MGRKKIKIEHIQDERNRAVRTRRGGCAAQGGGERWRVGSAPKGWRDGHAGAASCRAIGDAAPHLVLFASAWPRRRCARRGVTRGAAH